MVETQKLLVICPDCNKRLRVKPELAGKRVRCPNKECGKIVAVPAPDVSERRPVIAGPAGRTSLVIAIAASAAAALAVGVVAVAVWFFLIRTPTHATAADKLFGEWEGTHADGNGVILIFQEEMVTVAVLGPGINRPKAREAARWASGNFVRSLGGGGFVVFNAAYERTGTGEIKILGAVEAAVARPTKDGAYLLAGDFKFINGGASVPELRIERVTSPTVDPVQPGAPSGTPTIADVPSNGGNTPPQPATTPDDDKLPTDGPGDPKLTYDLVYQNPGAYRGKRVTWPAFGGTGDGKRLLCAANYRTVKDPRQYQMFAVDFATQEEFLKVLRAFGGTITGTVVGKVDVSWDASANLPGGVVKEKKSATVPLLRFTTFEPDGKDAGDSKTSPKSPSGASITEDKFFGEWEGTRADGNGVILIFQEKMVTVAVLGPGINRPKAREAARFVSGDFGSGLGGGGFVVFNAAYERTGTGEIKILGAVEPAVARPTKDGAYLLAGNFKFVNGSVTVPEVRIERMATRAEEGKTPEAKSPAKQRPNEPDDEKSPAPPKGNTAEPKGKEKSALPAPRVLKVALGKRGDLGGGDKLTANLPMHHVVVIKLAGVPDTVKGLDLLRNAKFEAGGATAGFNSVLGSPPGTVWMAAVIPTAARSMTVRLPGNIAPFTIDLPTTVADEAKAYD